MQKMDGDSMLEEEIKLVKLKSNPWPEFCASSYRHFFKEEKHITRICNYYVLIFMLERALLFTEDGTEIELKKGEWYIQKPNLLQQGMKGNPAPSYFYIHFNAEEEIDNLNKTIRNKEDKTAIILIKRGLFDIKLLKPLFEQLDYSYKNKPHDILSGQSIFLSILKNITITTTTEEGNGLAQKVTQYISGNYNKDINCRSMSEVFNFSTEYINRKVKQFCGLTPGQYLHQFRITRAKELLANTDHTLSYITSAIGYHDTTVFYKAFVKQTAMSPGEWRKKSRGICEIMPL